MRKVFPFEVAGIKAPRVVDAIKHDVRKYLKRERRKALPEGVDFWDFDCRVGTRREEPRAIHVGDLTKEIDAAVERQDPQIYVEILAKPGLRTAKPKPVEVEEESEPGEGSEEEF